MRHDQSVSHEARQAIDWTGIRRRLASVSDALDADVPPSVREETLRQRAIALACEAKVDIAGETLTLVECELAYERYGFELACIREVCPLRALTPLPGVPDFLAGIVAVRGQIIAVIDIRKFFDFPAKDLSALDKVVILTTGEKEFGVLVNRIVGIRRYPVAELQTNLPTLTDIRSQYLRGVTGDRLIVLDAGKILRDETLVVRISSPR